MSARSLLDELTAGLGDRGEARWVLGAALGLSPGQLAAGLSQAVPDVAAAAARSMAARRAAGEPLQYVLAAWTFRQLEISVDPRVLIPRPETEQVTGFALDELARQRAGAGGRLTAADLGTGSGVIALSLAVEGPPQLDVWGTDVSPDALDVARSNLERLALTQPEAAARVRLSRGSWFAALPASLSGRLHLVVSNPPYVSAPEWAKLPTVVRDHEPYGALVSGGRGTGCIERIVDEAPQWLAPGGALVVELAPHQAGTVGEVATRRGYTDVEVRVDLAGLARALVARVAS